MTDVWEGKWAMENLESFRDRLKKAPGFFCACCGTAKQSGEAAGARNYVPTPGPLSMRMIRPAAYALCLECAELPETTVHQNATRHLAKQGLFGER